MLVDYLKGGVGMAKDKKSRTNFVEEVKTYSPKELKAHHDECLTYYIEHLGEVSTKVLSRVGKVPQAYVRKWIKEEAWEKYVREEEGDKINLTPKTKEFIQSAAEKYGLSEQEELFCYHYLKTMNSTQAALRAGYGPGYSYNKGYNLLGKENVQQFLKDAKAQMCEEIFLDPLDVVRMWAKIAMADMNDFVSVSCAGVALRGSATTDGQLVTKIKEGKDGVTIELADKMKALDRLSAYFKILPQDKASQVKLEILQKAAQGDNDEDEPLKIEIVGV